MASGSTAWKEELTDASAWVGTPLFVDDGTQVVAGVFWDPYNIDRLPAPLGGRRARRGAGTASRRGPRVGRGDRRARRAVRPRPLRRSGDGGVRHHLLARTLHGSPDAVAACDWTTGTVGRRARRSPQRDATGAHGRLPARVLSGRGDERATAGSSPSTTSRGERRPRGHRRGERNGAPAPRPAGRPDRVGRARPRCRRLAAPGRRPADRGVGRRRRRAQSPRSTATTAAVTSPRSHRRAPPCCPPARTARCGSGRPATVARCGPIRGSATVGSRPRPAG